MNRQELKLNFAGIGPMYFRWVFCSIVGLILGGGFGLVTQSFTAERFGLTTLDKLEARNEILAGAMLGQALIAPIAFIGTPETDTSKG